VNPYVLVPAIMPWRQAKPRGQVFIVPMEQANRDVYRVGVGIDLLYLADLCHE
jgi:hypothetical protein